jgi:hypothetical protein
MHAQATNVIILERSLLLPLDFKFVNNNCDALLWISQNRCGAQARSSSIMSDQNYSNSSRVVTRHSINTRLFNTIETWQHLRKRILGIKYVSISLQFLFKTFFAAKDIEPFTLEMRAQAHVGLHVKCPVLVSGFK